MHRHSYTGRKLSRNKNQREALLRNLATSLILNEQITTTTAKAKEVVPFTERLITKAKAGSLHDLRQIKADLLTENASRKLVQELAPSWKDRSSGHIRIIKTGFRLGDNAPMAVVSLILPTQTTQPKPAAEASKAAAVPKSSKKPVTKPKTPVKKVAKVGGKS